MNQNPTNAPNDEGGPSKTPNRTPKPSNMVYGVDKGDLIEAISRIGLDVLLTMGLNLYEFEREVKIYELAERIRRRREESFEEEEDPSEGTWEEEEEDPSEVEPLEEEEEGELSHHSWKASSPIERESSPIFLSLPPPPKIYNVILDDPDEADSHILPFADPRLKKPSPSRGRPRRRFTEWKEVKNLLDPNPSTPDSKKEEKS